MRQTFKVTEEASAWQLEWELQALGYKWSNGVDSHVKTILEQNESFPAYIHVYTEDRTLTWSSSYGFSVLQYPVDATFEKGQSLFMDSDGNVHIYETSKPLDEKPKEPQYRYVPVNVGQVIEHADDNENTYYYEDDGYTGLLRLWTDSRFTIDEFAKMRFYKREEF